jgi:3',5'-cyclic AMP phosphodiesterase CpdA
VSDLHFGARNGLDDPALERAITELHSRVAPDLVIASGDLTHRNRRSEHETAAAYLRALGGELLVIPGNHDIPPFPPARFTRTWREFNLEWKTTKPTHVSPTLHVIGLNSVRALGYQRGRVPEGDLLHAEAALAEAGPAAFCIVAIHHQLAGAPWRSRKLALISRNRVLARLADAGAELIVGGHIHQATVATRRDFEVLDEGSRDCIVATAPGLGRPRPGRRYEVRGVLVHRADETTVRTETHIWRKDEWIVTGARVFPRQKEA